MADMGQLMHHHILDGLRGIGHQVQGEAETVFPGAAAEPCPGGGDPDPGGPDAHDPGPIGYPLGQVSLGLPAKGLLLLGGGLRVLRPIPGLTLLLALAMLLAMAVPAVAEENYSREITFTGVAEGDTVKAYKLGWYDENYNKYIFHDGFITFLQHQEPDKLPEKVADLTEWKNLTVRGYGHEPVKAEDILAWLHEFGDPIKPYITDVSDYLYDAATAGENIMFEAQLGALRDIEFGIYPYTSSSCTLAGYATIGAGIPGLKLDKTIGIMKAYSSCVGEGPFTVEMFGDEAEALRRAGGEYGAATGRPRRVGAFDIPASRYGVRMHGADCIALTKMDVLSYMDKIPVCVAYDINGEITEKFPVGERLNAAKPVFEYIEGFGDISGCRKPEDLPKAAMDYIRYLEAAVGCKIKYVSVGAGRDEYVEL